MQVLFLIFLFIIGACLGSFLCCQARRLHLKTQKPSKLSSKLNSRSICFSCHYQLKWYDNIPIFSWLFLKGKCRKCHKKISNIEFFSELGLATVFFALGATFDITSADFLSWITFIILLIFAAILGFLAIYDGAYGELPNFALTLSIVLAFLYLFLHQLAIVLTSGFSFSIILDPLLSAFILGGLYFILFFISKGKWVGDGDWLLGTSIGLVLASPWLALNTLFIANLLAFLISSPTIKRQKHKKVYFGPFMIAAFVIVFTFADFFYYAISIST